MARGANSLVPCFCMQGDKVKKGQTVAYVDQLGTFVAVEVGFLPWPSWHQPGCLSVIPSCFLVNAESVIMPTPS